MKNLNYEYLKELLENEKYDILKEELSQLHSADIADFINDLKYTYQKQAFSLLDSEVASDVLSDLHDDVITNVLSDINKERLIDIIDEMETDEATDIISDLEDDISSEVLEAIDDEDSESIKELLQYEEDSAGGIMQTEVFVAKEEMTVSEVIDLIRENADKVENVHYIFVVNNEDKLVGILELIKLVTAPAATSVKSLMDTDLITTQVDEDQETVTHIFRKYDIYALPVVDKEGKLLGRITVDDIIDVIDDEASEDAYKMVGLESEDRVFTTPANSVKKRLPWLVMNLFTALIISTVVGIFEPTIAKYSVLAVLMPIVAGLGGNAGIQTLTVITRGIALGELTIHNTWRAILKEVSVGVINGIIMGIFASIIAYLLKDNLKIGLILGSAMIINMFIAGLIGSLAPVLMKKMNIDPALSSSVVLTMLTDIGGYASFLGLATIFM